MTIQRHHRRHASYGLPSFFITIMIGDMDKALTVFRCISCHRDYRPDEVLYVCPTCGPRRGNLEVRYDLEAVRGKLTRESLANDATPAIWRYLPILPVSQRFIQPLQVGWTPLYGFERIARDYGVKQLYVKDDGKNPTASYKDRASAVVVLKAQEMGTETITCASTGNAASSMAGYAAATPLNSVIFVPASAPEAKITQLLIYGARVFGVEGSYDEAFDLCTQAAETFGWYNRSAGMNPYLVEGKKTGAWEIAEQLNWDVPDVVLVAVGDGSVISGVVKGFFEMQKLGLTERLPKVIGVQAEGAAPLAAAFKHSTADQVVLEDLENAHTIADSIEVGFARDGVKAIQYLKKADGDFVVVSDADILEAIKTMARRTGVFGEPAGAAAFAGFVKLCQQGKLGANDRVAAIVSGNGLKDIAAAKRAADLEAQSIPCDLDAVKQAVAKR